MYMYILYLYKSEKQAKLVYGIRSLQVGPKVDSWHAGYIDS